VPVGEGLEPRGDDQAVQDGLPCVVEDHRVCRRHQRLPTSLPSSMRGDGEAPGHSEQPRSCGLRRDLFSVLPGPQKRLLYNVLGRLRVIEDDVGNEPEQRLVVRGVQSPQVPLGAVDAVAHVVRYYAGQTRWGSTVSPQSSLEDFGCTWIRWPVGNVLPMRVRDSTVPFGSRLSGAAAMISRNDKHACR
jgi:hypothetical protein